ncbi:RNA polymerase sigma factor [Neoaquamicrobium sediminum]|uniref:RNA polymerase sigma factor n=1 Tax=Neoaquamicrobium sediminum TaxID=1849104 RepID=UPI003BAB8879
MSAPLTRAAYLDLLALARRHACRGVEADDLLQDTLAVALSSGRAPSIENRAWLGGVMRNLARMSARSAVRRSNRESQAVLAAPVADEPPPCAALPQLDGLAPSLRIVAVLALSGHNKAEIRSLLRISDEALRQRIAALRRALARFGREVPPGLPALHGALAFGSIRRGVLPVVRAGYVDFASHDPDGHPIAFRISRPETSQNHHRRQLTGA